MTTTDAVMNANRRMVLVALDCEGTAGGGSATAAPSSPPIVECTPASESTLPDAVYCRMLGGTHGSDLDGAANSSGGSKLLLRSGSTGWWVRGWAPSGGDGAPVCARAAVQTQTHNNNNNGTTEQRNNNNNTPGNALQTPGIKRTGKW